jgi:hypothetical protein
MLHKYANFSYKFNQIPSVFELFLPHFCDALPKWPYSKVVMRAKGDTYP